MPFLYAWGMANCEPLPGWHHDIPRRASRLASSLVARVRKSLESWVTKKSQFFPNPNHLFIEMYDLWFCGTDFSNSYLYFIDFRLTFWQISISNWVGSYPTVFPRQPHIGKKTNKLSTVIYLTSGIVMYCNVLALSAFETNPNNINKSIPEDCLNFHAGCIFQWDISHLCSHVGRLFVPHSCAGRLHGHLAGETPMFHRAFPAGF